MPEEKVWESKPSYRNYSLSFLILLFMLPGTVIGLTADIVTGGVLMFIISTVFLSILLRRSSFLYTVTNERVLVKKD